MTITLCEQRTRLLDSQKQLLVLGGPGSGKTTIALLKAAQEISNLEAGQKILFLSFARATVARVLESARHLVDKKSQTRIEIATYHGFLWSVLRSHGYLLNNKAPIRLLSLQESAVRLAHIKSNERPQEYQKMFRDEAILSFDLFAPTARDLFEKSMKIRELVSDAFPLIIVDEFQDTDPNEWEIIKFLGMKSRIIALADPDQRIYEFRGADPARIGEFINYFNPEQFDFGSENNRSSGTDINIYANDLLSGVNVNKTYIDVNVVTYQFLRGRHEMFYLKTNLLAGIRRLNSKNGWSIAILVPTKRLMLTASNYLSSQLDGLPTVQHDVAIDAEGPMLAGEMLSLLLDHFENQDDVQKVLINGIINHLKGRRGNTPPTQADYKLAQGLEKYLLSGKINGSRRVALVSEIGSIAQERMNLQFTGNPLEDWKLLLNLFFQNISEKPLIAIRDDARYIRLLNRGSDMRALLSETWRDHGYYRNAGQIYSNVLQQEQFSSTIRKQSGIYVMTMHKSKGKQFNEVFLFEGANWGRFSRDPANPTSVAQARLTLRVGVSRATEKTTILTPRRNKCHLL